ncbi:MAG: hypothetical protein OXE54_09140, partial [Gammaproteobacteria bacterium]|nr:hypothetical protein [Gammaproteobacteria bacterium]
CADEDEQKYGQLAGWTWGAEPDLKAKSTPKRTRYGEPTVNATSGLLAKPPYKSQPHCASISPNPPKRLLRGIDGLVTSAHEWRHHPGNGIGLPVFRPKTSRWLPRMKANRRILKCMWSDV